MFIMEHAPLKLQFQVIHLPDIANLMILYKCRNEEGLKWDALRAATRGLYMTGAHKLKKANNANLASLSQKVFDTESLCLSFLIDLTVERCSQMRRKLRKLWGPLSSIKRCTTMVDFLFKQ